MRVSGEWRVVRLFDGSRDKSVRLNWGLKFVVLEGGVVARSLDLFRRIAVEGESAIDELIAQAAAEHLFLDFKRKPKEGDLPGVLAKAVSGFGNSDGGVILWGVDCRNNEKRGDVASEKIPIDDPSAFRSTLERLVSGCTIPPHSGVEHLIVSRASGSNGFVVTHVPAAPNLPLQDTHKKQYFMRAGSNFEPIPHGLLSALFGRRPVPRIGRHWEVHHVTRPDFRANTVAILASLRILNYGPTIAREPFASVRLVHKLGGGCVCKIGPVLNSEWPMSQHGRLHSTIAEASYRLPPGGVVEMLNVELVLPAPPLQSLRLECSIGCDNAVPLHFVVHASAEKIAEARDRFLSEMPTEDKYLHKAAKEYGRHIFSLEEHS